MHKDGGIPGQALQRSVEIKAGCAEAVAHRNSLRENGLEQHLPLQRGLHMDA